MLRLWISLLAQKNEYNISAATSTDRELELPFLVGDPGVEPGFSFTYNEHKIIHSTLTLMKSQSQLVEMEKTR